MFRFTNSSTIAYLLSSGKHCGPMKYNGERKETTQFVAHIRYLRSSDEALDDRIIGVNQFAKFLMTSDEY